LTAEHRHAHFGRREINPESGLTGFDLANLVSPTISRSPNIRRARPIRPHSLPKQLDVAHTDRLPNYLSPPKSRPRRAECRPVTKSRSAGCGTAHPSFTSPGTGSNGEHRSFHQVTPWRYSTDRLFSNTTQDGG